MIALQCYERIVRWLIGSPAVVIFPSQWLLDFYDERGFFLSSKKVVLQNPIEIRSALHVTRYTLRDTIHLLYVGQLEKHKGIMLLIEAIKKFPISNFQFPIILDVVGGGSLLDKIKKVAVDDQRIRVHGAVPHEKLSAFYANADALVVPSLVHENAPTVIFEAFAHGLPVIASRVGGISEFVRDGVTGWTFTAGDADALQERLQYCIAHRAILKQCANNCRAAVLALSPRQYVERLFAL